jgi:hypothetical protein
MLPWIQYSTVTGQGFADLTKFSGGPPTGYPNPTDPTIALDAYLPAVKGGKKGGLNGTQWAWLAWRKDVLWGTGRSGTDTNPATVDMSPVEQSFFFADWGHHNSVVARSGLGAVLVNLDPTKKNSIGANLIRATGAVVGAIVPVAGAAIIAGEQGLQEVGATRTTAAKDGTSGTITTPIVPTVGLSVAEPTSSVPVGVSVKTALPGVDLTSLTTSPAINPPKTSHIILAILFVLAAFLIIFDND